MPPMAKTIGYVLEDPDTNARLGELQHKWLRDIWCDHNIKDRERYDPDLHTSRLEVCVPSSYQMRS